MPLIYVNHELQFLFALDDCNTYHDVMDDTQIDPMYAAPMRKLSNAFTTDLGTAFGQRLKGAREKAALTQQELADRAGVARVTLANWEAGEGGGARLDQVKSVAAALGLHAGELAYGRRR